MIKVIANQLTEMDFLEVPNPNGGTYPLKSPIDGEEIEVHELSTASPYIQNIVNLWAAGFDYKGIKPKSVIIID